MQVKGASIAANVEGNGQRLVINGSVTLLAELLNALRPAGDPTKEETRPTQHD